MFDNDKLAELLATAQETLKRDVIDLLPPDKRHVALMVNNAISIVARALNRDSMPAEDARCLTASALGVHVSALDDQACARIRDGACDPGTQSGSLLRSALEAAVRAELAVTNPKLLRP